MLQCKSVSRVKRFRQMRIVATVAAAQYTPQLVATASVQASWIAAADSSQGEAQSAYLPEVSRSCSASLVTAAASASSRAVGSPELCTETPVTSAWHTLISVLSRCWWPRVVHGYSWNISLEQIHQRPVVWSTMTRCKQRLLVTFAGAFLFASSVMTTPMTFCSRVVVTFQ